MALEVTVITTPLPGTAFDAQRKPIDWNNSSDRKWLTSHMHWAFHNQRKVEIIPANH